MRTKGFRDQLLLDITYFIYRERRLPPMFTLQTSSPNTFTTAANTTSSKSLPDKEPAHTCPPASRNNCNRTHDHQRPSPGAAWRKTASTAMCLLNDDEPSSHCEAQEPGQADQTGGSCEPPRPSQASSYAGCASTGLQRGEQLPSCFGAPAAGVAGRACDRERQAMWDYRWDSWREVAGALCSICRCYFCSRSPCICLHHSSDTWSAE